jgi:glycosyltransferase involved in cell wall biosynthesis
MIRVAVIAPERLPCGIADYVALHLDRFPEDIEPRLLAMPGANRSPTDWRRLAFEANACDLVHVHFECGLFAPVKPWRNRYLDFMGAIERPRLVTLHDAFPRLLPRWQSSRPWRLGHLARDLACLPLFSGWDQRHYRQADHCIVHTETLHALAADQVGSDRVSLLPMPVPETERRWRGMTEGPTRLITPGFIKPHKGYERLLNLLAVRKNWHWTLAGEPQNSVDATYAEQLRTKIRALGLDGRVEISGHLSRNDMESRMAEAALAVFPFRHTAGSSSIAWAMGVGLPVVTTDLPAARGLLEAGAGITLLPAEDAQWDDWLAALLANGPRLQLLSRKNLNHSRRHDFGALARKVADIYRAMIEPGASK